MSRHTEPMTDAYVTAQRLRNSARVGAKIEQLGSRWLLHPDNAIDPVEAVAQRRAKAMREARLLIVSTPSAVRSAFEEHAQQVSQSGLIDHPEVEWIASPPPPPRKFSSPMEWACSVFGKDLPITIDQGKDEAATALLERAGLVEHLRNKFMREGGAQ